MDKTKATMTVVCDAGPVIHLDELGCLHLLSDFQEIFLPDTVWKEIGQHRPSALKRTGLSLIRSRGVVPSNEPLLTMCRMFSLDVGENEALALMEQISDAMFLTDDAAARIVAKQLGYNVHGTIGILVRAIRRSQMSPKEVLDILTDIPLKSGLYIRLSLLEDIQKKIKSNFNI